MVVPVAVTLGGVRFCVTVVVAVLTHPLTGFVTVTEYTPVKIAKGFCKLELKPLGPDHEYVTPDVLEEAWSVTAGFVQVFTPPVAVAPGGVVFELTVTEAVFVQPF
jgi:hypothetical protein